MLCFSGEAVDIDFNDLVGPLRNIHISNDNASFSFYVDMFFLLSLPRLLPDLAVNTSNTVGVL